MCVQVVGRCVYSQQKRVAPGQDQIQGQGARCAQSCALKLLDLAAALSALNALPWSLNRHFVCRVFATMRFYCDHVLAEQALGYR